MERRMATATRNSLPHVSFESRGPTDMSLVVDGTIVSDPNAMVRYSHGIVRAIDLVELWRRIPGRAAGELARSQEWLDRHTAAPSLADVRAEIGRALDLLVHARAAITLLEADRGEQSRQAGIRG